jgi:DNA adenine methylase
MQNNITRPALRYHGGKFKLAPWIISHFPAHRIYVEPYGGAASVLLRKPRSYAEVYNDLDGEIVNLFRVLRDPILARELVSMIELTPFSRVEFEESYTAVDSPVEQARRTVVRSFMGFGSVGASGGDTGFRNNATRSGSTPAGDWRNYPPALACISARLKGVVVENLPAVDVMQTFDGVNTLHYVDPPYPMDTRSQSVYRHEMTDEQHTALAGVLNNLRGMVVISGYRCPMYDELYADWRRVDKETHADGARDRIESLWIKGNTNTQGMLFT